MPGASFSQTAVNEDRLSATAAETSHGQPFVLTTAAHSKLFDLQLRRSCIFVCEGELRMEGSIPLSPNLNETIGPLLKVGVVATNGSHVGPASFAVYFTTITM